MLSIVHWWPLIRCRAIAGNSPGRNRADRGCRRCPARRSVFRTLSTRRVWRLGTRLVKFRSCGAEDWAGGLAAADTVSGPGLEKYGNLAVGKCTALPSEFLGGPTATNIARLGIGLLETGETADPRSVEPLYLRRSFRGSPVGTPASRPKHESWAVRPFPFLEKMLTISVGKSLPSPHPVEFRGPTHGTV